MGRRIRPRYRELLPARLQENLDDVALERQVDELRVLAELTVEMFSAGMYSQVAATPFENAGECLRDRAEALVVELGMPIHEALRLARMNQELNSERDRQ